MKLFNIATAALVATTTFFSATPSAKASAYCYERSNDVIATMEGFKDSFKEMYIMVRDSNTRQDFIETTLAVGIGAGLVSSIAEEVDTLFPEFQSGGQCYSYNGTYAQNQEVKRIEREAQYYTQQLEVEFERKQNYYQVTEQDFENLFDFSELEGTYKL